MKLFLAFTLIFMQNDISKAESKFIPLNCIANYNGNCIVRGITNTGYIIGDNNGMPFIFSIRDNVYKELIAKTDSETFESYKQRYPKMFSMSLDEFNSVNNVAGNIYISVDGQKAIWKTNRNVLIQWDENNKDENNKTKPYEILDEIEDFFMSPYSDGSFFAYESLYPKVGSNILINQVNVVSTKENKTKLFTPIRDKTLRIKDISSDGKVFIGHYEESGNIESLIISKTGEHYSKTSINTSLIFDQNPELYCFKKLATQKQCILKTQSNKLFKISNDGKTIIGFTTIYPYHSTLEHNAINSEDIDALEFNENDKIKLAYKTNLKNAKQQNNQGKININILYSLDKDTSEFIVLNHSIQNPFLNQDITELYMSKNHEIIGGKCGDKAFIWTYDTGALSLKDFLEYQYTKGDFLDWYSLDAITGISPNGKYICGYGLPIKGSNKQSFYLDLSTIY